MLMLTVWANFLSTSAGRRPAASVQKHDSADPSDYERRHRMCLSKVPYLTKNDAIYAAK